MPTSPPYLRGYPAEQRRDAWLQWAFEHISPAFKRFPGERAYVVFQLENLKWIGNCGLPSANSDSDAWCRLKQTWGPSEPPPKGTIPSVVDCEVVRLLNKGYVHEYIELNLRKHGWDPYKCCDPSLKVEQKRLHAPSPAKPSSSAAATPASTGEPSGSTFGEGKGFDGQACLFGQPETSSLNQSAALNTSVSEEGVSKIKNAGEGSTEKQMQRHVSAGHETGNQTVGKHNTPPRGVPSFSKPVVSSGIPVGGSKGSVGARVIMKPLRADNPSNAVQDPAKSCDELDGDSIGRHPRSVPLANDSTPQNVKRNLQSHNSQSRPAAEKDSKTQSPASENLQTTVTPKEEHLRVNDDLHKNNIERMSAKLFKSSRPTLHAYLRDEIEAMSKTVMGNMRKRTVEVLGRQSNSHLGFATLRDVEDLTLVAMEAEINSVRKAALGQIDKLDKQGSDVPIKREASEFEEGGVAEHAPEAKRQRTSNSANSQDCIQS
ncbi:hypothetical protein CGCTS75_v013203 [Colletotrichum tropicale]|nr:hypothetical protein CGCTS75_v013203 [Colletotrichum tropicale]